MNFWPMMDSANPLKTWPIKGIMARAPAIKNDPYGGVHYLVKSILRKFCNSLA
jgi:hypothetical protein